MPETGSGLNFEDLRPVKIFLPEHQPEMYQKL
jgi:hypothetical protein